MARPGPTAPYNPAEGVRVPRVARKEPVFLAHGQVDRLAEACPGFELLIRLMAYTGLGEVGY